MVDFDPEFSTLAPLKIDYFDSRQQNREISLEVLIDRSSIETFFFEGMYAMTNLVYPKDENATGIEIFATDPTISVKKIYITILKKSTPFSEEKPKTARVELKLRKHAYDIRDFDEIVH